MIASAKTLKMPQFFQTNHRTIPHHIVYTPQRRIYPLFRF